jgi:hypothetical protein
MNNEPGSIVVTDDERRAIGRWAADCAERVLPLFETKAPSDKRPGEALEGIREFARGGKRTARLRSLALAAHAAAREVGDPSAAAAARAAGVAAAVAYMHALADADQTKHLLGAAVYAARARELAEGRDSSGAEEEIRWALEHASPIVREVLRRYPVRIASRSRLDALYTQLDTGLRART